MCIECAIFITSLGFRKAPCFSYSLTYHSCQAEFSPCNDCNQPRNYSNKHKFIYCCEDNTQNKRTTKPCVQSDYSFNSFWNIGHYITNINEQKRIAIYKSQFAVEPSFKSFLSAFFFVCFSLIRYFLINTILA